MIRRFKRETAALKIAIFLMAAKSSQIARRLGAAKYASCVNEPTGKKVICQVQKVLKAVFESEQSHQATTRCENISSLFPSKNSFGKGKKMNQKVDFHYV